MESVTDEMTSGPDPTYAAFFFFISKRAETRNRIVSVDLSTKKSCPLRCDSV
jgi:hypothetical protein